ncbi:MAG: hypothetical protein DYH20_15565 [Gammaproteobacteria bacterium PRO9]|nr:hypothetical protein [Gammaproteobacteria bacterium PRO9]
MPSLVLVLRGQAQTTRVLRGGSFNNTADNVRCAARNRNNPNNRNRNIGFRVVVATLLDCQESTGGVRPSGPRREMAEPVPGRAPFGTWGRANNAGSAPWALPLGRSHFAPCSTH